MNQIISSECITMSSQEISDLVGSRHDSVKRTIERLAERGTIQLPPLVEVQNHMNQSVSTYQVCKRDSFVVVAQLSPEFTAALVDRWQELEAAQPTRIPQTYREALLAVIASEEAKELALLERDRAIETKAEIGHRREATAMNTASQAVKKVAALQAQLDVSAEYCTIKRMEMLKHGQKFEWRRLKHTCTEMGVDAIDVFDQNYGTVKAYHESVWLEAYGIGIES